MNVIWKTTTTSTLIRPTSSATGLDLSKRVTTWISTNWWLTWNRQTFLTKMNINICLSSSTSTTSSTIRFWRFSHRTSIGLPTIWDVGKQQGGHGGGSSMIAMPVLHLQVIISMKWPRMKATMAGHQMPLPPYSSDPCWKTKRSSSNLSTVWHFLSTTISPTLRPSPISLPP